MSGKFTSGSAHRAMRGFTLVEMIVVIVITGIIGGMVAIFIKAPVQGYMDSSRRAELTDIADTALRRLARDIRSAVPNSVRVPGGSSTYVEFLPTSTGGRYRGDPSGGSGTVCNGVAGNTAGDALNFDAGDSCFEITGQAVTFSANDWIVIGSTQSSGTPAYDSSVNGVRRQYTGAAGAQNRVVMTATKLPSFAELPGQRFDVVPAAQGAVTYACIGTLGGALSANSDGQAQLVRYWNYVINTTQPVPPLGLPNAVLADRVSDCAISYDVVNQRTGLVSIRLEITRGGESVSLFHQVHVNNIP